jgi:hypothetical protein
MIRRILWLGAGGAVGALVTVYTLAGIRRARGQLDPATAPARVAAHAGRASARVREAVAEGRRARSAYEDRAVRARVGR